MCGCTLKNLKFGNWDPSDSTIFLSLINIVVSLKFEKKSRNLWIWSIYNLNCFCIKTCFGVIQYYHEILHIWLLYFWDLKCTSWFSIVLNLWTSQKLSIWLQRLLLLWSIQLSLSQVIPTNFDFYDTPYYTHPSVDDVMNDGADRQHKSRSIA